MALLPCDLSLIEIHISDYRQFSDFYISQGSVATYLRCCGTVKYEFVANLPWVCQQKNFENRLTLGEVMGKCLLSSFLTHGVDISQGGVATCLRWGGILTIFIRPPHSRHTQTDRQNTTNKYNY